MKKRSNIFITKDMPESFSWKKNMNPFQDKVAAQRSDLFHNQLKHAVIPIISQTPIVDSALAQDMFALNTCIQKINSKTIKLIGKFKHQFRTIYIYETDDGVIQHFDTYGTNVNEEFAVAEKTDLELLEVGEEYKIDSNDDFYLKYTANFDPVTRRFAIGNNVRAIVSTNVHNAQDSVSVSESFVRKFTTLKSKTIRLTLTNKKILSKYGKKLFPDLGELIHDDPILCKVVSDENPLVTLSQSADIPSGLEDDIIFIEPHTYISSIEVYCNNTIKDPVLEQYRQDLLNFRAEVYNTLCSLDEDKFSPELKILKNNFGYVKFRNQTMDLKHPHIQIRVNTLDMPQIGSKATNLFGGKFTIQHIYPDDNLIDEYGRTIEVEYAASGIIARAIPSVLYEIHMSGISDLLYTKIHLEQIDMDTTYEFVDTLFKLINEESWRNSKYTKEDLWEMLQTTKLPIILLPFSHGIDIKKIDQITSIAEKYIDYRKLNVYVKDKGTNYIKRTCKHAVGMMYVMRDSHDIYSENSSCSVPELDLKGIPVDKDSSRADSRALFGNQGAKLDILTLGYLVNMSSNPCANIIINGTDENRNSLYMIKETLNAVGADLSFKKLVSYDEYGNVIENELTYEY